MWKRHTIHLREMSNLSSSVEGASLDQYHHKVVTKSYKPLRTQRPSVKDLADLGIQLPNREAAIQEEEDEEDENNSNAER